MRTYLLLLVLLTAGSLSSCRCADPPPIGPVEGGGASASVSVR